MTAVINLPRKFSPRNGRKFPISMVSSSGCTINLASNDSMTDAKVERPSAATSVPATVAALRMLSGASSLRAVFSASGVYSLSSNCCRVTVAPISRLLPFFCRVFRPRAWRSTTLTEADLSVRKKRPAAEGQGVWLFEQFQRFGESFRSIIISDHSKLHMVGYIKYTGKSNNSNVLFA